MLFDTPDRVQHMLWRFRDREHPNFEPDLSPELATRIEEHYRRCDALLGAPLDKVDENTLLIVLSDHGFGTFRRAFDTNTWLWQNGLLALKNNHKPEQKPGEGFASVDWSKTYAYAVGLGGIYLNFKGREGGGILEEGSEAERVRRAIQTGLADLPDTQAQRPAIRSVSRREELYSGAFVGNSPDLLVNFHRGFRVSWESAVGGFAQSVLADNLRRWSGDHIVDPESVPGILFMNRAAKHNHARIIDLAPTVLSYLGVAVPESMEGASLL
jgi:predicted AlkP superfamily phosphohydrolase/phosphomutase